ncbi:DUF6220 domain-containing protein [Planococcus sp. YIM B11945]|uniref:DUF6220 domain-containing protein n=1 Tax=Planococcus sp. YIM B11945 TaxID=3435410 RepID=UPI003D7E8120
MEKQKTRIRIGRIIYFVLACLFAACVLVQLFVAGMGTFVNPANWAKHVLFIHLFGLNLPLLLLVSALIGSMPRWAYRNIFALFFLIFTMYFTANMAGASPWIGALHPVIAVLLAAVSCANVNKVNKLIFNKKGVNHS